MNTESVERKIVKVCGDIVALVDTTKLGEDAELTQLTSNIHVELCKLAVLVSIYFDDVLGNAPTGYWVGETSWDSENYGRRTSERFGWPCCDQLDGHIVRFAMYEDELDYNSDGDRLDEATCIEFQRVFEKLKNDAHCWITAFLSSRSIASKSSDKTETSDKSFLLEKKQFDLLLIGIKFESVLKGMGSDAPKPVKHSSGTSNQYDYSSTRRSIIGHKKYAWLANFLPEFPSEALDSIRKSSRVPKE